MYKILKAEKLADKIYLMDVEAPRVAKHCEPGQFVIVKMDDKGERIPLTICDYDREKGTDDPADHGRRKTARQRSVQHQAPLFLRRKIL